MAALRLDSIVRATGGGFGPRPSLRLLALRLPALRLPALRLPALRLRALRLPDGSGR